MSKQTSLKTIGKYEILGTLGRGSMGVVYRARDPEIGRLVAVKTLRRLSATHLNDAESSLERFRTEARSAGRLRHPNIITIFDVNVEGDVPYIVMDYVEGESLDTVLAKEERFSPIRAMRFLTQIAAGLDAAHKAGVIHRDIKPSNLILDSSETVYILDFGVARMNESIGESENTVKQEPVMGTPGYMSPEQILNESLDGRTDLFSLAIVAFEFFTGSRPFDGRTYTEIVGNILNQKPPPLTSYVPELPLALEEAMEKALEKNRDKRFGSAAEMVAALELALGLQHGAAPMSADQVKADRQRKLSEWQDISRNRPRSSNQDELSKAPNVPYTRPRNPYAEGGTGSQRTVDLGLGPKPKRKNDSPGALFDVEDDALGGSTRKRGGAGSRLTRLFFVTLLVGFVFVGAFALTQYLNPSEPPTQVVSERPARVQAILSVPNVAPVPEGKEVTEMTNQEVLGILVSDRTSDIQVLEALSEALSRNIPGLLEAAVYKLSHDSFLVRIETIKTLVQHGDRRAVPHLVDTLSDHDPLVRGFAAEAIGQLGSRAAVSYLLNRYQLEKDERVKTKLRAAIERINGYPMTP